MTIKRLIASPLAVALLALALLVSGAVWLQQAGPASGRAHGRPAVAAQQRVAVIVSKIGASNAAEKLVARLGGTVTRDLSIVNAFAAELPMAAVSQVAASPSVAQVTPDGPVTDSAASGSPPAPTTDFFRQTLGVTSLPSTLTGKGIGVAVVDSGIDTLSDFGSRIGLRTYFITPTPTGATADDLYGHGTAVAGVIGGSGAASGGLYTGVAPGVTLYGLRIADNNANATESDAVAALQWVYNNKDKYNIRVVNLSINASAQVSYNQDPLDAACEILWFDGVTVVTSAGNKGPTSGPNTVDCAPANDPFVITVGASDESGSASRADDFVAPFSAFGTTSNGFSKPDVIVPGARIITTLSSKSAWGTLYPSRTLLKGKYIYLSGTSMSAPMVCGVVALLLQDEPNLTPDQVKYRLIATAPSKIGGNGNGDVARPYISASAAVNGTTTKSSNTGITASQLLWTGTKPVTWGSTAWNSVMWKSVDWNSVMWKSVMWKSVMWKSIDWSN